jgi:large subunit ribosomal protein L27e
MAIIKNGKVVIMLRGRFAGRKAIVVKTYDDGHGDRKFGHAIVAGIDRYPRKLTKSMSDAKAKKRSKIKPFIKSVNYTHMMPTRYSVDMDIKKAVADSNLTNAESRLNARKAIKERFEDRYMNQSDFKSEKKASGAQYFFRKLRF